jgi:starch phosphorylase
MGKFSSDRAIAQYCNDIWQTKAVPIQLEAYSQINALLQIISK